MLGQLIMEPNTTFALKNHENVVYDFDLLKGENGVLMAFTDDVWEVSSVRFVLWLQRQNFKLATLGVNCALVVPNQPYELNGFFMSIPRTISFPLLADPDRQVYENLGMEKAGYMLLDADGEVVRRFYVNETASLSIKSVMYYLNK